MVCIVFQVEIIFSEGNCIFSTLSRLCKRNMFQSYHSAVKMLCGEGSAVHLLLCSYLEAKNVCKDYIRARDHFFRALRESGAGKWLKKPMEEKMFHINV